MCRRNNSSGHSQFSWTRTRHRRTADWTRPYCEQTRDTICKPLRPYLHSTISDRMWTCRMILVLSESLTCKRFYPKSPRKPCTRILILQLDQISPGTLKEKFWISHRRNQKGWKIILSVWYLSVSIWNILSSNEVTLPYIWLDIF